MLGNRIGAVVSLVAALLGSAIAARHSHAGAVFYGPPCEQTVGEDVSDPVTLANGDYYYEVTDFSIPGVGMDFVFRRKYRASTGIEDAYASALGPVAVEFVNASPMGRNWCHSYDIKAQTIFTNSSLFPPTCGGSVFMLDGTGRVIKFISDPCTPGVQDPVTFHANGYAAVVTLTPDGNGDYEYGTLVVEWADGRTYEFEPYTGVFGELAKISRIIDRNGNTMDFAYDGYERLTTITDTLGRDITFGYSGTDKLIRTVTDFVGRAWTYDYYGSGSSDGNAGDLKSVTLPAVATGDSFQVPSINVQSAVNWTYKYYVGTSYLENNLKSITDANGNLILTNYYLSGTDRIERQTYGGADYGYEYSTVTTGLYRTVVKNRGLNVKEFRFTSSNDLIYRADLTGRVSSWSQVIGNPAGWSPTNKVRASDPAAFVQEWTRNSDSMPTVYERPNGETITSVYETGGAKKKANLLQRTRTPGSGGGSTVVEYWRYHANLGGSGGCGCGSSFATFYQDGNGNRWYSKFDAAGNLERRFLDIAPFQQSNSILTDPTIDTGSVSPGTEDLPFVEEFSYDPQGRMLSHRHRSNGTNRRLDVYTYYDDTDTNLGRRGMLKEVVIDADQTQTSPAPLELTTTYDYNPVGRISSVTSPMGFVTVHGHDHLDRSIFEKSYKSGTSTALTHVRRIYDANGNVIREDTAHLDSTGVAIGAGQFSVLHAYDVLNYRTLTVEQVNGAALADTDLSAATLVSDSRFVGEEYAYDANKNLIRIEKGEAVNGNQTTNVIERTYDERDLLFEDTNGAGGPDESTTQYVYTEFGRIRERIRGIPASGSLAGTAETEYEYDGLSRVKKVIDTFGSYTIYAYDSNGNGVLVESRDVTDVLLAKTEYGYDALDRNNTVTEHIFGPGLTASTAVTTTVYNPDSSVEFVDGPVSGAADRTYYDYDTASRLIATTDPGNNVTALEYDAGSRVTARIQSDDSEVSGAPTEVYRVQYTYDELDNALTEQEIMPTGLGHNLTTYVYDSRGLLLARTDANSNERRWAYDGLGREVSMTIEMSPAADIETSQVWDASSRLVAQIDDNGNMTAYAYDGLDRRIVTRMADGTMIKVGTGTVTWTSPPALSGLSGLTSGYDPRGNAVTVVDSNQSQVTTTFDLLNRPTARSVSRGPNVVGTTFETYSYDGLSRVLTAANDETEVTRVYDSLSRVLSETSKVTVGSGPVYGDGRTVAYVYDNAGNIVRTTYPNGRIVDAAYDGLYRTDSLTHIGPGGSDPTFTVASFKHVGRRVARRTHGNDTEVRITYANFAADPSTSSANLGFGHPKQIEHVETVTPTAILTRDIRWDRVGNKVYRGNSAGGIPANEHDYEYDRADRLVNTQVDSGAVRNQTYVLDGVHNRTSVSGMNAPYPGDYYRTAGNDNALNQYSFTPALDPVYDKEGNIFSFDTSCRADINNDYTVDGSDMSVILANFGTAQPNCSGGDINCNGLVNGGDLSTLLGQFGRACSHVDIRYDFRNRTKQWFGYGDNSGGVPSDVHEYVYDCFGRRVSKHTDIGSTRERRHRFTFGGHQADEMWQLLQMEMLEGEATEGITHTFVFSGGYIDDVVSMRREYGSGEELEQEDYWYHQDDLLSVVTLSDEAGDVLERYEFQDYGQEHITMPDGVTNLPVNSFTNRIESVVGNPFTFTGREIDCETGLLGYRTRLLHPATGRFTSRDVIGVWGDPSAYGNAWSYVGSRPTFAVDPWGLWEDPLLDPPSPYRIRPDRTIRFTEPGDAPFTPGQELQSPDEIIPELEKRREWIESDIPGRAKPFIKVVIGGHGHPGWNSMLPWLSPLRLDRINRWRKCPHEFSEEEQKSLREQDALLRYLEQYSDCVRLDSCRTGQGERGKELLDKLREYYPGTTWNAPEVRIWYLPGGIGPILDPGWGKPK